MDLIGCLTIPFRYLILFEAGKLSKLLCIITPPIIYFSTFLTLLSLVVAAIERYRAVRFIDAKNHKNDKMIFVLIAFSALVSLFMVVMSRFQIRQDKYKDDAYYCATMSHNSFFESPGILANVTGTLVVMIIFCSIFVITVLYIKIAFLLRRRIAAIPSLPSSHQQPVEDTSAKPEDKNKDSISFQDEPEHWREVMLVYNPPQEKDEESCEMPTQCMSSNYESQQQVADIDDIEPEFLSRITPVMLEEQQDNLSTSSYSKSDVWTQSVSKSAFPSEPDEVAAITSSAITLPQTQTPVITSAQSSCANLSTNVTTSSSSLSVATTRARLAISQSSPVKEGHKGATVIATSQQNALLGLSHQLPGAVTEDNGKVFSTSNYPSIRPRQMSIISTGGEEPTIPTLQIEEQIQCTSGITMIAKTTLMLFIATLMFIITYGLLGIIVMSILSDKAADFFLEFMLINHVINPFVYNFVNEGFRDECRGVFKKIKLRRVLRKPVLTEDHEK